MVFYRGRAHKLEDIEFHIDTVNYLAPWTITSNDGRFEMTFEPVLNRHSDFKVLALSSRQNQLFGYYSGKIVLDDGNTLQVDRMLGLAEDVLNAW